MERNSAYCMLPNACCPLYQRNAVPDFLPRRDGDLLTFVRNLRDHLLQAPVEYGIDPGMSESFAELVNRFEADYQVAMTPGTRTIVTIQAKDTTRAAMIRAVRTICGMVRTNFSVSNSQRITLGIRPLNKSRTRIGRPQTAPAVHVVDTDSTSVEIRLIDPEAPARKAKPRGTVGALIFVCIGEEASEDPRDWRALRILHRTQGRLTLGQHVPPASRVWIAARWLNPRLMPGPMSREVHADLRRGKMRDLRLVKAA